MLYWSQIPLVKLSLCFLVGIALGRTFAVDDTLQLWGMVILASLLVAFLLSHFKLTSYRNRWVSGVISHALVILLGTFYSTQYKNQHQLSFQPIEQNTPWIGEVVEVSAKQKSLSVLVRLNYVKDSSNWLTSNDLLLVYTTNKEIEVRIGDVVSSNSTITKLEEPKNPQQFNYKAFLANRQIFLTTFVDDIAIELSQFNLYRLAEDVRNRLITKFQAAQVERDQLAVLVALFLGDKSRLEYELKQSYAGAGAMHILAVSGLHVGIIFLIFQNLLKLLPESKLTEKLKAVVLILVVWIFAFLTGLSPSVQRAACMFSFVALGGMLNRKTHVINSIATSALVLMLFNPNVIFEVGFQLSYFAVVGIVLIHPKIYNWYRSSNWLLDKTWSLIVVSFAAQLSTLPITLYYFHQFPNWFLLTNIFVIPLAFVIVSGAVILSFLVLIFNIDLYLGWLLNKIISLLNYLILKVGELPYPVTPDIWISEYTLVLSYLSLVLFVIFLWKVSPKWFNYSLSLVLLSLMIELFLDFRQIGNRFIGFYAVKQTSLVLVDGLKATIIELDTNENAFSQTVINNHLHHLRVNQIEQVSLKELHKSKVEAVSFNGNYNFGIIEWFGSTTIFFLEKKPLELDLSRKNIDFIYYPFAKLEKVKNENSDSKIILSKSWQIPYQLKDRIFNTKNFVVLSDNGYFQIDL